jgi:hypothetical protein
MIGRRAVPGYEPVVRAIRLQTLSDVLDAFGSTWQREPARTTLDWQRWMSSGVIFILASLKACTTSNQENATIANARSHGKTQARFPWRRSADLQVCRVRKAGRAGQA